MDTGVLLDKLRRSRMAAGNICIVLVERAPLRVLLFLQGNALAIAPGGFMTRYKS